MGADFIEKATPNFKKTLDRGRTELATSDLFTKEPSCEARTAVADIINGEQLSIGEQLTVEAQDKSLVARRGNNEVARFENPPHSLLQAVIESYGIAKGKVEEVHEMSKVAEISLC
ncbi:MAG: hypothetical protein OXL41_04605 [Nitrospinae bacterium]|nr:hypothetical protein [Nitrospinota bacterium]